MRLQVKFKIIIFFLILSFIPAYFLSAETLKDSVMLSFDYYSDNADVKVYTPSIGIYKKLSEKFQLGAKMRVDAITAATKAYGGSSKRVDAVTGATPSNHFDEVRYAPSLMGIYNDGDNSATIGGYYSTEPDYKGMAVFANYARQLNDQNTTLGIGVSQSFDKWDPNFKRELPRYNRNEKKIDLSVTQLLSPTLSAQFVYTRLYSDGFLSSPYHYLLSESYAVFERYPSNRTGNAYALRLVKLINEPTSINLAYRYYKDNWDISSHTFNIELYRDIAKELTLGTRYRHYTQSKSGFMKELSGYSMNDEYIAVDYRNSAFNSSTAGLMAIYKPGWKDFTLLDLTKVKIKGSVDYYWTSDNDYIKYWYDENRLKAVFTSLSLEYAF